MQEKNYINYNNLNKHIENNYIKNALEYFSETPVHDYNINTNGNKIKQETTNLICSTF